MVKEVYIRRTTSDYTIRRWVPLLYSDFNKTVNIIDKTENSVLKFYKPKV